MISSRATLTGVVHGRTIELAQEPGLPDGQQVCIHIEPISALHGWLERIVIDPAGAQGQPVIRGTRVPAEQVVQQLEQGRTPDELRESYPELTSEDIEAARQFGRVPEGLRRSFGGWADDAEELNQYLDWNRQRRREGCREVAE